MEKYYIKAVVLCLTNEILIGIGRGVEVIPTTKAHISRIIERESPKVLALDLHADLGVDGFIDEEFNSLDVTYHEVIDFQTNLLNNDEYSEFILCIDDQFYLIRPL